MLTKEKKLILSLLAVLLTVSFIFGTAGCTGLEEEGVILSDDDLTEDNNTDNSIASDGSETAKIIETTNNYLTKGNAPTISVEDVYNKVIQGGDSSYFLLSIRKPEHYARGHIEGSINIPYGEMFKKENIAKLPKDKKIVVICYTGHTASQIAMMLNQLGYDATAMKFGMMGWTSNPDVLSLKPFISAPDYEIETTPVKAEATNELPGIGTDKSAVEDIILARTEDYLTKGKAPTISVEDVYKKAVESQNSDYAILSIRKPEHYAIGHIPGAINIPFQQLAKEENLKKLPNDKKIIVVCYTGHTASYATMFLNQLGYDAYAMKFGMMGWTSDSDVLSLKPFTAAADYPTVTD